MLSNARRLALPCALVSSLVVFDARSIAQTLTEHAADVQLSRDWLGTKRDGVEPALSAAHTLWQGRGAMVVEQQRVRRLVRSWWPEPLADARAEAILDGFALYLSTHRIERMFDEQYLRTAHSVETRAYFGAHVMWSFPTLRLSRQIVAARDPYGAVFTSLEQWIGIPTLQSAMFQVAHLPEDRLTAPSIIKTISDAAGQDLSWAFDAAQSEINYAVASLSAQSITVSRHGNGMFTGRTAARVDDFQSGDALQLRVLFADGTSTLATWDGRDQTKTLTFQGPSSVVAAYLDPDRIVTLDSNRLDNAIVPATPTNVPVRKWVARWMVWLQHTMLSYGFLS